MPRKWIKRHPEIEGPTNENILQAVNMVCTENKGVREVAKAMNISKSALSRHIKKYRNAEDKEGIVFKPNLICGLIFTPQQEDMLKDYIIAASKMHHGLTRMKVCNLAYEYANALNLKFPESWENNKKAGEGWYQNFMDRHKDLSLRSPESTSLSRATSFNKTNVQAFMNNLKNVYERYKFPPERIYNSDETGVSTVHNPPKVIAEKGEKQVGQVTSAERGELVTMLCTVNAVGNAVPPVFVFPRVRYKDHFIKGAPAGSLGLANKSGWMTAELFYFVLKHIIKHTKCSKEDPILLLLDNSETHISIEIINLAREHGVVMVTFSPHTSHRMQPLDVSVFAPFKGRYNMACNNWLLNNPGKTINIYCIPELVCEAYLSAFTQKNIVSGFKKTGIFPYNSEPFSDDEYLMSSVTDLPESTSVPNVENHSVESISGSTTCQDVPQNSIQEEAECSNVSSNCSAEVFHGPFTSTNPPISPADVCPLPKAAPRTSLPSRRGRKKGKTRILTDTPEKEALEREDVEKEMRKNSKTCVARKSLLSDKPASVGMKRKISKPTSAKRPSKKANPHVDENVDLSDECNMSNLATETQRSQNNKSKNNGNESEDRGMCYDVDNIGLNNFVFVKFCTKRKVVYYVGRVEAKFGNAGYSVQFLRRKDDTWQFCFPQELDMSYVDKADILFKLPHPDVTGSTERLQSMFTFDIDLSEYSPNVR